MIVVALATVAIVVATVLMVWPQNQQRGTNVVTPPAPANMDTNPMPETPPTLPPASTDPWSGTGPAVPAPIDPSGSGMPIPTPDPDADVDVDPTTIIPNPSTDPNAPIAPPSNNAARDQFVDQLATSVCKQIAGCTNIDQAMTGVLCDAVVALLNQTSPGSSCSFDASKAATCLQRVRTLTCNSQLNVIDAVSLLNDLPACLESLRC